MAKPLVQLSRQACKQNRRKAILPSQVGTTHGATPIEKSMPIALLASEIRCLIADWTARACRAASIGPKQRAALANGKARLSRFHARKSDG